jgi:endonuclease/exonuclease/phosphatase family metal-dependent hydrolase
MEAATMEAPPSSDQPGHGGDSDLNGLSVMTMNLQYFASYPQDEDAARRRLLEVTGGDSPPDVICVQEALANKNVLDAVGFRLQICSGAQGVAQSVYDMVYGDAATLRGCKEEFHNELLCNQIYMRRDSKWLVIDSGVRQISTDLQLVGGGGRAQGKLAQRSMVWVRVRRSGATGPTVFIMNSHITGGRFEDQYFVQQLSEERFCQPERIIRFFEKERPNPEDDDVGIFLGDFNATADYVPGGAMAGYFKASIAGSQGVQADADAGNVQGSDLEEHFKSYMISPFTSIKRHGWSFAYGEEVGITSGFGHLIDHMAMSRPLKVLSSKVIYLTNQKFGNKKPDTDLPLTDHNSVKTVFLVPDRDTERKQARQKVRAALVAVSVAVGLALFMTRSTSSFWSISL